MQYLSWHNSLWLQWRRTETKRTIRSSSPASHSRAKQTDGEGQKSSKRTVNREESSSDWKCEIPFKFSKKKTRRVNSVILPCVRITSLKKGMCTWRQMTCPTCWDRRKVQQEVKERWCKRISYDIEGVYRIELRVSSRKSLLCEQWKLTSKHVVKFSKDTWHQKKIGKQRIHREELSKSVRLMSVVLARQNSEKGRMRRLCNKNDTFVEYLGLHENIYILKKEG